MHLHVACVSVRPNLKPEVADGAAASACDCGRTGGHSFCQTHWDWWSRLERRPGVFSYSNGRGRDSWTLYSALWACTCAYLHSAACVEMHCAADRPVDCVSVGRFRAPNGPAAMFSSLILNYIRLWWLGGFQILTFDDINVGDVVLDSTRAGCFIPEQLPFFSGNTSESKPFRTRIPVRNAGIP